MSPSLQAGRARLTLTVLAAAVLAALAGQVPAAGAAPNYVSLGDSFTAGPLIPNQIAPYGCLKSDRNYPHLAAPSIGLPLRDPSCSGADTSDMTAAQSVTGGSNPPQFNSLAADTRVVTLGIGGNDIGFTGIIEDCASPTPFGRRCQDNYVVNGRDEITARIQATAPKVGSVLRGIRQRSPSARIFVVNYLPVLPETGIGLLAPDADRLGRRAVPAQQAARAERDARLPGGGERGAADRRLHGGNRQGRLQGLRHPLGRAHHSGERGRTRAPQPPGHAGHRRRGGLRGRARLSPGPLP